MFEGLGGIAGDSVEAPSTLSGVRVVCGEVATDGPFGAAGPDDYLAFDDANGRGQDGVASGHRVLRRPDRLAGFLIHSDDTAVQQARQDTPVVDRDSAVDRPAAQTLNMFSGDTGVPPPFVLPVRASTANITSQGRMQ